MGVQVDLQDIQSGFLTAAAHTANNTLIEAGFDNALDRTASTNNAMSVNLDMGTNRGINAADGLLSSDLVTKGQLDGAISAAGTGLIASQVEVQTGADVVASVSTLVGLTYTLNGNNLYIFRNGNFQTKDVDYTETSENSITWITDPNSTDGITFVTNLSTTNNTTDTSAISHTQNSTLYNLATYLQDYPIEIVAGTGSGTRMNFYNKDTSGNDILAMQIQESGDIICYGSMTFNNGTITP